MSDGHGDYHGHRHAARVRDRRLRRAILLQLHHAASHAIHAELNAQTVVDACDGAPPYYDRFESPSHAVGLIRQLVARGYLTERRGTIRLAESLRPGHLNLACTSKGHDLALEQIPPDPLVYDERIADEPGGA